jgi:hydrogenase maturation protein HypF
VNINVLFPSVAKSDLLVVRRMLEQGMNSPLTSSCGRLFDAVAALIGIRPTVNYEAQAAIELEASRDHSQTCQPYPLAIEDRDGVLVLGTCPLFEAVLADLRSGASRGKISQRFHDGLIAALVDTARFLKQKTKLTKVCLSGGSFQNRYLLEQLQTRLQEDDFEVFSNAMVPAGDGGLSLGQAMIAAHMLVVS